MFLNDSDEKKPRILVFAGPNGSGKSTITKKIPVCGLYVNADEIKRVSGCTDLEAVKEAELIRHTLLEAGKDFTFETVLSTRRNLDFLEQAKEKGYEIFAVFVLTNDRSINVQRVLNRVRAGGHDVPEEKIKSRYKKSLDNLSELVRISDHTRIVDNSGKIPALICEIESEQAILYETDLWKKKDILRLLARKKTENS